MSHVTRTKLTLFLTILMALSSFAAGFFVNDLVQERWGIGVDDGDNLAVFREAWQRIDDSFMGEKPGEQAKAYAAIRGSLGLLNDPYTVFVEPQVRQVERETLRGNFGGIGATLQRVEDGRVLLTPLPNNPAEIAGILEGDTLLAVNNQAITSEMTVAEIAAQIKGEKGTTVTLTISHAGSSEKVKVAIERGDILIPSVWHRLVDEDKTIGYIQLTRFTGESGSEVEKALLELQQQGADKYILDLRHNGGGLLDAAVAVADHFLSDGLILEQIDDESTNEFLATAATVTPTAPLVILINGGTASAAEIVAGALQDRERAKIIGTPSFGKGSVQLVYDLSDGSSIHVTSARWYTPAGNQLDGHGLQPDILVEQSQAAIDDGKDLALETAIAFLRNE